MKRRRIAVLALTGVVLAAAGGGAIAATNDDPEQSIINDAAKRLNVTPQQLRDALGAAEDAQLDKDVKAGKLTQDQADAIKKRRHANGGTVLGPGPGPGPRGPGHAIPFGPGGFGHGGPGRFDHGGPGAAIAAGAKVLGLSQDELFKQLRDGKSLADIAKAQGKDLADVKAAVRAAVKADLDAAVKDKHLTQAQADDVLKRFDDHFDEFAQRSRPPGPPRGFGRGGWPHP
jgi:hypothetical protein